MGVGFKSASAVMNSNLEPPTLTSSIIERADARRDRIAVIAPEGVFTYGDLLDASSVVATRLLAGRDDMEGERVCFLVPPGWTHVATQWGIWRAGGIAVPLATSHPPAELAYVLGDAQPEVVVAHSDLMSRVTEPAQDRGLTILQTEALVSEGPTGQLPRVDAARPAMMLYTSGTTGRPKGVVISHANVAAQVESLTTAWGWSDTDQVLLHLPLHHVHGIVNILTSALWNGAICEILPRFNPVDVWERLSRGDVTLYMAVPTVYRRLIEAWEDADAPTREAWSAGARACRVMISGSAALPVPTLERWEEITGQRLLERYGMTEIGMALSNPLDGERRAGHVGRPLPGVSVRLVNEEDEPVEEDSPGNIQVQGPTVFARYWNRDAETEAVFTADGWFRTGDLAVVEGGAFRILGRSSVDILKTGGEKISALEIEDVLRGHPGVADCAVVGVPDADWGDKVCAAVVRSPSEAVHDETLRAYAKERLAPYKVPKEILLVDDLPRNAMGKVMKQAVRELFEVVDEG